LHIFELLFDCLINYLYMRVLKLTLGKIIFLQIFLWFQLPMWNVRTNLFYGPDVSGSVHQWSSSVPSGQVSNTSGRKPITFSASRTPLIFFLYLLCHVVCVFSQISLEILASLHNSSHSIVFSLFSFGHLSCYAF